MKEKLIHAQAIKKSFYINGKLLLRKKEAYCAVDQFSIDVYAGEIVSIIGKNGAGKTTAIKMLAGIMKPDFGEIEVFHSNPFKRTKEYCNAVSLVMGQKGQMDIDVSIADNILYMASIYGITKEAAIQRMTAMAKELHIADILHQQVRTLSLGQKMKGELVLAFLHEPKIVFLDEPTLGLDYATQLQIRQYLLQYVQSKKAAVILTSHNISDIETLSERILIIDHGKTLFYGDISELKTMIKPKRYITFQSTAAFAKDDVPFAISILNDCTYQVEIDDVNEKDLFHFLSTETTLYNICFSQDDLNEVIENLYRKEILCSL